MPRSLDDYLDRIETMLDAGDGLLRRDRPVSPREALQKCVDAALLIGAYQLFVHRELFDPLGRHPEPAVRDAVRELKVEGIALSENLRVAVRAVAAVQGEPDLGVIGAQARNFNPLVRAHIDKVRKIAHTIHQLSAAA